MGVEKTFYKITYVLQKFEFLLHTYESVLPYHTYESVLPYQ